MSLLMSARYRATAALALLGHAALTAQAPPVLSPVVRDFVRVDAPVVALTHVRVIDGTGTPAVEDQTIVIAQGRIAAMGGAATVHVPAGADVRDLSGYTVVPGLVGMHNHLFYPVGSSPALFRTLAISAPRLYLAAGVTTIRTGGSMEPIADLNIKRAIDEGRMPGPTVHLTAPFVEGARAFYLQMHRLSGPEDARRMVNYWADSGFTSFKAFMNISRAQLAATIGEAHKRGLKVTGHLCSVGFRDAIELGIDNLEHGWNTDTDFTPEKAPDVCPPQRATVAALAKLDVRGEAVQGLIRLLVERKVAVTSTLAFMEGTVPGRPLPPPDVLDAMSLEARSGFLGRRLRLAPDAESLAATVFKKEMEFERAFVGAGGLLMAGADPTGDGGVLPGFGDLRNLELLVEAGFTPLEAIRIAGANGAAHLGESARIGTLAPGKQADLVVVRGNPAARISDMRNVEIVFKQGVGYDAPKLIASVRGSVGQY